MERATFAAGCFWGSEETFQSIQGVVDTQVGYTGDSSQLGSAEVVELSYDPQQISYEELLEVFWRAHDPTQLNRQGPDIGTEYRSVIFVHSPKQRQVAELSLSELQARAAPNEPLVTQIEDADGFRRAADFHQRYFEKKGHKKSA